MALMLPFITPILPLLLLVPLTTAADADRLGSLQATLPLRYVGGRTIVSPGIGTPPQPIPLVLSPDVSYLTVVGHCTTCLQDGTEYDASSSTSAHVESGRSFNMTLPGRTGNASETLTLGGMIVRDTLSVNNDSIQLPEGTCSIRKIMSIVDATGGAAALGQGVSGHWGLGFNDSDTEALIPAACPPNGSVTIGFDLKNSSAPAGDMHWGGVPSDAYQGRFNWLATSESNWAVGTDGFRVGPIEINVKKSSTAVLDPGLDDIFVPSAVAESFYESLGGERDKVYTERWNLPCDLSTDVRVRLSGVSYNLATSSLVVPRDKLGRTCWGSVVAWSNGSVPETEGEIRLGAAFISGVYMAMTYNCDNKERHIGLAAKPHSANPNNVYVAPKSNRKTIAIVLGVLLPLLALLLLCCLFCLCRKRLPFRRRPHEHEHEHEHEYEHEHEHYGCTHGVPGQCPGCAPVSVPISGLVHIPPHHASRTSTPSPRFQEVPLLNPAPVRSPRFQEVPLPNPPPVPSNPKYKSLPPLPPPTPLPIVGATPQTPAGAYGPVMSMAAPVVASQYAVPFTPVAPVRPVAPMLPVTPMPVTTMPAHSAQPWMYAPVPVQCEMEGSETLGEAWLRSRSHPHPHAHGHSKEKRQLGSSSSGSTTG